MPSSQSELPNIAFVRIHTDEGLVGTGETNFGARTVSAWIHETAATSGPHP